MFSKIIRFFHNKIKLLCYAEYCVVLGVIGNKSDLYENDDLADEDEAKEFAQEIGAIFVQVSAKMEKIFLNYLKLY